MGFRDVDAPRLQKCRSCNASWNALMDVPGIQDGIGGYMGDMRIIR